MQGRAVQGEPPKLSWWGPDPTHTPSLDVVLTYHALYKISFENKKGLFSFINLETIDCDYP